MQLTRPFADYPHIRRVGSLYFLAGQGCRDPESDTYAGVEFDDEGKVLTYNIVEQTRGVLRNISNVLSSVNLTKAHLVDVTVFLTNMNDFQMMNDVWNEFFTGVAAPTRTTVAVKDLPGFNFIEMKAVASHEVTL